MLLIAFGTRPEWIKIKPLIDKIPNQIKYKLLYIRQHNDLIDKFITNYNPVCLDIYNSVNRLDSIIFSILNNINPIFENVTHTLIQGDTTSALAVALSSFHRKIPVIHLEAGLRSGDMNHPYPEEFNRIAISNIASVHLCPTQENLNNIKSNYSGDAYLVGNTVLDNLKNIQSTLENKVLITLHRRENLKIIEDWFVAIEGIATIYKNLEFIFPMHPNSKIQKHKHIFKNVKVIDPLPYDKCINMVAKCSILITDSGGLQEESSFLQKKSIICRTTTERKEGLGTFSTLCKSPKDLYKIFKNTKIEIVNKPCPYGDGNSCDKILNILKKEFDPIKITKENFAVIRRDTHMGKWAAESKRLDFDQNQLPRYTKYFKQGDVLVNVGANIGCYAKAFIDKASKVICFEPHEEAFTCLKYNLEKYANVELYNTALSHESHMYNVIGGHANNIGASLIEPSIDSEKYTMTLDDLNLDKLNFILMDCEGSEYNVLLGARSTIHKFKPIIVTEVNDGYLQRFGSSRNQLFLLLDEMGYTYKNIFEGGSLNKDQFDVICFPTGGHG